MAQGSAKFLKDQIARIRRLLAEAWDKKAEGALKELAHEYEVRASELERREKLVDGSAGAYGGHGESSEPKPPLRPTLPRFRWSIFRGWLVGMPSPERIG